MFKIVNITKSRAFGSARYSTEYISRIVGDRRSTRCLTVEICPWPQSEIDWNGVNMSEKLYLYIEYSSGMRNSLCQAVLVWFWEVNVVNSCSVLMVPTTARSDCTSWEDFSRASSMTIVDISSFTYARTMCMSKCCSFVVEWVTRIKTSRLDMDGLYDNVPLQRELILGCLLC